MEHRKHGQKIRKSLSMAVLSGIGAAVFFGLQSPRHLTAQNPPVACSPAMLSGGYSYSVSGTIFNSTGLAGFYSVVGVLTADGRGSVVGTDTISTNGVVQSARTYTGTYVVQANCTGTITTNYQGQIAPLAFSVAGSGDEISFMQTNNGTVGIGIAHRQITPSAFGRRF